MPNSPQLQSYINILKARREQLKDRQYFTQEEEDFRKPIYDKKIEQHENELKELINHIPVIQAEELPNNVN